MKFIFKLSFIFFALAVVSCKKKDPDTPVIVDTTKADSIKREAQLNTIIGGFETRRNSGFQSMAGKPLERGLVQPSISNSGIFYHRDLSYSLIDFAAKCFWLDEQNIAANDALLEHCNIYVNDIEVLRDRDSFYWAADELCRIVELFGSKGTRKPGLLTIDTEDKIYEVMWKFAKDQSKLTGNHQLGRFLFVTSADFSTSNTWDIEASENHNIQGIYARWHFSKLLKEHNAYKTKKYDDGFDAEAHFNGWTLYMKKWILERAKKGLFIEMGNDAYNMDCLKGIYGFYDYGPTDLRDLTQKFLDLYWATWAQEQIDGVSGGSKARVYPGRESIIGATHFRKLAWYYFGIGAPSVISKNIFTFVTSNYRVPSLVIDIATDTKGRGNYEIIQRRLGLANDGFYNPPMYRVNQTEGLVRYSYCTPDFILGTFNCGALSEPSWTMISSQNRWHGVIFDGNSNSRIYPQCAGSTRNYNQHWGVQNKGTMIVQKLLNGTYSKDAGAMQVWIGDFGLTDMIERDGWVFVSSKGAYAAIRPVADGYTWSTVNEPGLWSGKWLIPRNQYTPVIIEVAQKKDYNTSYKAFQDKVISRKLTVQTTNIQYESTYGDKFQFFTNYSQLATVNGNRISTTPTKVMSSPFVNSDFNSGIYTIKKGSRLLNLNFN